MLTILAGPCARPFFLIRSGGYLVAWVLESVRMNSATDKSGNLPGLILSWLSTRPTIAVNRLNLALPYPARKGV